MSSAGQPPAQEPHSLEGSPPVRRGPYWIRSPLEGHSTKPPSGEGHQIGETIPAPELPAAQFFCAQKGWSEPAHKKWFNTRSRRRARAELIMQETSVRSCMECSMMGELSEVGGLCIASPLTLTLKPSRWVHAQADSPGHYHSETVIQNGVWKNLFFWRPMPPPSVRCPKVIDDDVVEGL